MEEQPILTNYYILLLYNYIYIAIADDELEANIPIKKYCAIDGGGG